MDKREKENIRTYLGILSEYIWGESSKSPNKIIQINNTNILKKESRYDRRKVLVLLPRCMQNSSCTIQIIERAADCRRCGACDIGDLVDYSEKLGLNISVVSGGTAARSMSQDKIPELIIAVACERELISGIRDVRPIPVLGIINKRLNGCCKDTRVELQEFYAMMDAISEKFIKA